MKACVAIPGRTVRRETDRQTADRQTDRQTDRRQTDRQTARETDRQAGRDSDRERERERTFNSSAFRVSGIFSASAVPPEKRSDSSIRNSAMGTVTTDKIKAEWAACR